MFSPHKFKILVAFVIGVGLCVYCFRGDFLANDYVYANSMIDGEITEVLVVEEQAINEGDHLLRVANPTVENKLRDFRDAIRYAEEEKESLRCRMAEFEEKLRILVAKARIDIEELHAEIELASKAEKNAKAIVESTRTYLASGALSKLEFGEFESAHLASQSKILALRTKLKRLQLAIEASESNIFVNQDDVSDELSQLKLSLKVAEDKHRDSVRNLEAEEIKLGLLVVAPRNGQVTTILGQVGNPVSPNSQLVVLDSNED